MRLAQPRFPAPRRRGDEVEISFVCEGTGESNQFAINKDIAFASWTEAWYPIPTPLPGESLSSVSRAAGRTQFNVPAGWSVVSNDRHVSREAREGGVVDIWETDAAVSRSFAAGSYVIENRKAGDLDVAMYLLSDIPGAGDHVVPLANAMEAMEDKWGSYPCREAAPDAELETFFAQWLDHTGAPVLETSWEQASDGAEVTIHQRQTGDPFYLRLDVLLRLANGEEALHQVQLRDREQRFELSASATVVGVQLDPRNRLLLWSPQYGAPTASIGITAPALTPEQIATYEGNYVVEGRSMIIRIFASEMRLMVKVATGVPTSLWPVD